MMRGMYAAISGLEAHQTMLDVTANNLANVDTVGFKAQRTTFVDELSQLVRAGAGPNGNVAGSNPEQVGLGVTVGSIDNLMTTGSLQSTGNPTDVAIQGDGFLRVTTGDPSTPLSATQQIDYTRNGDMTINPKGYLTTQEGQYVVGRGATPSGTAPNITYSPNSTDGYINVPPGSTDVAIGQDGSVSYVDQNSSNATYQQRVTAGYLTLSTFPNEAGHDPHGRLTVDRVRGVRDPVDGHAKHRGLRPDDRRHAGDVQRRHGDRVHQHDPGRAWLPGQLVRDQHRRPDAPDPGAAEVVNPHRGMRGGNRGNAAPHFSDHPTI